MQFLRVPIVYNTKNALETKLIQSIDKIASYIYSKLTIWSNAQTHGLAKASSNMALI